MRNSLSIYTKNHGRFFITSHDSLLLDFIKPKQLRITAAPICNKDTSLIIYNYDSDDITNYSASLFIIPISEIVYFEINNFFDNNKGVY